MALNQWYHVAACRTAAGVKFFLAGVLVHTSGAFPITAGQNWRYSPDHHSANGAFYNGDLDEWRLTWGVARYDANFPPPTQPFPGGAVFAPAPSGFPLPPAPQPIAFSVVTRPTLFAVIGSVLGSTTLATVTCADAAMTISLSEPVAGLTFSYAANVLTVAGTPTGATRTQRVVVSYVASDGTNRIRGSSTHTITLVSASEILTIGVMGGAVGRVGSYMSTAGICSLTSNYDVDVTAEISGVVPYTVIPGFQPGPPLALAWSRPGRAGTLAATAFIPSTPGTYNIGVTYKGNGQTLGTSTHAIVIDAAYSAPSPSPAPVPAPSPPAPSPPPVPSPAPAPGLGPDSLFSSVKVLMHFDAATGIAADVKGNTFTNYGVTSTTGAVGEAGLFTDAFTRIEGEVSGISGRDGLFAAECMVKIDAATWAALNASGTDQFWCPVLTCLTTGSAQEIVWTLGLSSSAAGYPLQRYIRSAFTVWRSSIGPGFQLASGPLVTVRPDRFVHLVGGLEDIGSGIAVLQAFWDGQAFPGSTTFMSEMRAAGPTILRIGGLCPPVRNNGASGAAVFVPFAGAIDEVRVTAANRYAAEITGTTEVVNITPVRRVIPWPNY